MLSLPPADELLAVPAATAAATAWDFRVMAAKVEAATTQGGAHGTADFAQAGRLAHNPGSLFHRDIAAKGLDGASV